MLMAVAAITVAPLAMSAVALAVLGPRSSDGTLLLLPALVIYVFEFGWWVIAAMILLSIALHGGRRWRRWQTIWTVVAAFSFLLCAVPLGIVGRFPWPLVPSSI